MVMALARVDTLVVVVKRVKNLEMELDSHSPVLVGYGSSACLLCAVKVALTLLAKKPYSL